MTGYQDVSWLRKNCLNEKKFEQGAFVFYTFWLRGHLINGEHIQGYTGPETVVTIKQLKPIVTFNYLKALAAEFEQAKAA